MASPRKVGRVKSESHSKDFVFKGSLQGLQQVPQRGLPRLGITGSPTFGPILTIPATSEAFLLTVISYRTAAINLLIR